MAVPCPSMWNTLWNCISQQDPPAKLTLIGGLCAPNILYIWEVILEKRNKGAGDMRRMGTEEVNEKNAWLEREPLIVTGEAPRNHCACQMTEWDNHFSTVILLCRENDPCMLTHLQIWLYVHSWAIFCSAERKQHIVTICNDLVGNRPPQLESDGPKGSA